MTSASPRPAAAPPTALTTRRVVSFGAGNFSAQLMLQTFATLAVFYYVDTLGADPRLIAIAMAVHGVFNALLNPLFGYLSDRTKSRWGRRIPWIMFGAVPLAAAFTLVWIPFATTPVGLFWNFLVIVLIYDILFVLVVLNYGSLFPEMFRSTQERARGSAWRQLFAIVGLILGVALGPVLYGALGWAGMGIVLGALVLLGFVIALSGSVERAQDIPEPIGFGRALRATLTNRVFLVYVSASFLIQLAIALMQAAMPFFTKYVIGDTDPGAVSLILGTMFVVAIPMVYVWSAFIRRFGSKPAILATVAIFILGLAPFLLLSGMPAAIGTAALVGVAIAGVLVLLDILLAEIIDIDAERVGQRREGMYLGVNGFIVRWSVTVQAVAFGLILPWSGYNQAAPVQPESVAVGVRALMSGLPIAALAIAFVILLAYPHRRPTAVTPETLAEVAGTRED
ncbi:MFS transporter [Mycetocola tolaasinivorans]|uniref:MFS transporter n=2 Tax=Mycetocola tolaasinivorans TaxID=76635 RepID=A0A3L7A5C3_9MICO|nr:MFS transporter [Mycetocola tolaasinivorans]RLP75294.1 MFS transporter [Mycetocola tolaasinivorans]